MSHASNVDRLRRRIGRPAGWTRSDAVFLVALVLLGARIYYVDLGATVLASADEGLYANVARHMLDDGRWIVPHLYWAGRFGPYMDKPPLVFWFQAASMAAFGVNEFAVRFPAATFAVLTGALAYVFGRDLYDRRTGFLAGVLFLTTPHVYAGGNAGRVGALDTGHVFFGTLLVFCVWKAARTGSDRWLWRAAAAAVPALLAKGFAAGVFLVVLAPLVVLHRRAFVRRVGARAAATAVGLGSVWPAYMWWRYGSEFVHDLFVEQVLERLAADVHPATPVGLASDLRYPFLEGFPVYFDPGAWFLVPAIAISFVPAIRGSARDRAPAAFLVWWAGGVVLCFGLAEHAWYLLPVYVPCSLLVGRLLARAADGDPVAIGGVALAAALSLLFSPQAAVWSPVALPGDVPALHPIRPRWGYAGAVVAGAGVVGSCSWIRRRATKRLPEAAYTVARSALPMLAAVLIVSALVGPVVIDGRDAEHQQRAMARAANELIPEGNAIHLRGAGARHPLRTFGFYARRPIERVPVGRIRDDRSLRYALVTARTAETIPRNYTVVARSTSDTLDLRLIEIGNGRGEESRRQ